MSQLSYEKMLQLCRKGVIKKGCGVRVKGLTNDDEYAIRSVKASSKNVYITILNNGKEQHFNQNAIITIDGLDPQKLYEAYNEEDCKRGRPKKIKE